MPTKPDSTASMEAEPQTTTDLMVSMYTDMQTIAPHPIARGASLPPRPDNAAFDSWLRRELTMAHDAILHEPVPERLLRLLRDSIGG